MLKNLKRIILPMLVFLILTSSALAAGSLDKALDSLKDLHLIEAYNNNYQLVDSIFYFIIFIGVAKVGFGEKFKDSNVPVIIGIILGIAMTMFEYQSNFKLGKVLFIVAIVALVFWVVKKLFMSNKDGIRS